MRRFTRLANACSKELDNHIHALALYFACYNFFRVHKTLRLSPAMATGVTDRHWSLEDIATSIDADALALSRVDLTRSGLPERPLWVASGSLWTGVRRRFWSVPNRSPSSFALRRRARSLFTCMISQ